MNATMGFVLVLLAAGALGAVAWGFARLRARLELRSAMRSAGIERSDRGASHATARPTLRPLEPHRREEIESAWRQIRVSYHHDPLHATVRADVLARRLMQARGVATHRVEQGNTVMSERYPEVLRHYIAARAVVEPLYSGRATQEQIHQAMGHYSTFIEAMMKDRPDRAL